MSIILRPETEGLVQEELRSGRFHSVDEIILEGVRARREGWTTPDRAGGKSLAEAVANIRNMRIGNRLPPGVTIKDLIGAGRA